MSPSPLPLQSARQKEAVEVELRAVQEDARERAAELQQQLDTAVAAKAEKVSGLGRSGPQLLTSDTLWSSGPCAAGCEP